jgi:hypothetical protein
MLIDFSKRQAADLESVVWRVEFSLEFSGNPNPMYAELTGTKAVHQPNSVSNCGHACPLRRRPVIVDLHGTNPRGFIGVMYSEAILVTAELGRRLREHHLTGFQATEDVEISCNQSDLENPEVASFQFIGSGGSCMQDVHITAENFCPNCGHFPLVCLNCGTLLNPCESCGMDNSEAVANAYDAAIERDKRNFLINSGNWDKSDFFQVTGHWGGEFVSTRAKKVIEEMRLFGVRFRDALLRP